MSLSEKIQKKTKIRKRRLIISFSFLFFLLLIGWLLFHGDKKTQQRHAAPEAIYTVVKENITLTTDIEGQLKGDKKIELSFPLQERIISIDVRPGEKVYAGKKLATIEKRAAEIALAKAENRLQEAINNRKKNIDPLSSTEKKQQESFISSQKIGLEKVTMEGEKSVFNAKKSREDAIIQLADIEEKIRKEWNENDISLTKKQEETKQNAESVKALATMKEALYMIDDSLKDIDLFFGVSRSNQHKNIHYDDFLGAKDAAGKNRHKMQWQESKRCQDQWIESIEKFDTSLQQSKDIADFIECLEKSQQNLYLAGKVIEKSLIGPSLTQGTLDQKLSLFQAKRSTISQKIAQLETHKEQINLLESSGEQSIDSIEDKRSDYVQELATQLKQKRLLVEQKETLYEKALQQSKINKRSQEQALEEAQLNAKKQSKPLNQTEENSLDIAIQAAKIALEEAEYRLAKTELLSPVDGTIVAINQSIGEYPSAQFMIIATKGNRYIEARIEEEDVNKLSVGQKAIMTVDALDEREREVEIYDIGEVGERDTNDIVSYTLLLTAPDDEHIRSSMTVGIEFITEQENAALVVPTQSIINNETTQLQLLDGTYVNIEVGISNPEKTAVTSGLKEGDQIFLFPS